MPLLSLSGLLPQAYWVLLAAVCVVVIGVSIFYLLRNRKFHLRFMQTLSQTTDSIAALDRCKIENLESVREAMQSDAYPLLSSFGDKLAQDADRLYQGKWIGDPTPLLQRDHVLTRGEYRSTSSEIPVQILSVSVLASSVFLLFGLSSASDRDVILRLASLPAILGSIATLLLFFQSYRARLGMDRGLTHLAETITEKVPVFRELAGTAALIESFFRYDRQMADSITQLTNTVEELTHSTLADKLAENVRLVLERELTPPMVQATETLGALAGELTRRQEDGMKDLAENFTTSLAASMEEHLSPFYQEISNLTQDLYEANKQTEISLSTMENFKQQSLDIQQGLNYTIEELRQVRSDWQTDLKQSTESLSSLALTSAKLASLQAGSEANLAGEISILRQKIGELQDTLYRVTQGLHMENQHGAEVVHALTDTSQKTLGDMRQLTMLLVDQTDVLSRQNDSLRASLTGLENGLNQSVQNFSTQLLAGVSQTLDSFDEGLAELTERLSNTTAEINDTVGVWVSDIRWSEEYRYANRLDKKNDSAARQQALLNLLDGKEEPASPAADTVSNDRKDGESLE